MAFRKRLNHVAAGLLDSFVSRCNDLEGFWVPGMLYAEVGEAPHHVTLDLLDRSARPANRCALHIAARYAGFLEHALRKKQLRPQDLAEATVAIQFRAGVALPFVMPHWIGDVFVCTVTLRGSGDSAIRTAYGKCLPHDPRRFARSVLPRL